LNAEVGGGGELASCFFPLGKLSIGGKELAVTLVPCDAHV